MLSVGARRVDPSQAQAWIARHSQSGANGWPNYDRYDSGTDDTSLSEPDLLAPALLNVPITLDTFPGLRKRLPQLNTALRSVPRNAALSAADVSGPHLRLADDAELAAAAAAFSVLDQDRPTGVRLTKLAKILHRKRPRLLPLYDQYVRVCYCLPDEGVAAAVPPVRGRSYVAFVAELMQAMRQDFRDPRWRELDLPEGMTTLRALDIVAWHVGQVRRTA